VLALRFEEQSDSGVNGNVRPSLFFVVPGSRRTWPALKSTFFHVSDSTSDFIRQPVK
jgi:hypothetical protein